MATIISFAKIKLRKLPCLMTTVSITKWITRFQNHSKWEISCLFLSTIQILKFSKWISRKTKDKLVNFQEGNLELETVTIDFKLVRCSTTLKLETLRLGSTIVKEITYPIRIRMSTTEWLRNLEDSLEVGDTNLTTVLLLHSRIELSTISTSTMKLITIIGNDAQDLLRRNLPSYLLQNSREVVINVPFV